MKYTRTNLKPNMCYKILDNQEKYQHMKNDVRMLVNDYFLENTVPIYRSMGKVLDTREEVQGEIDFLIKSFQYAPFFIKVDYYNQKSQYRGDKKYDEFTDDERVVVCLEMNKTIVELYKGDIDHIDNSCDYYSFFYILIYKIGDKYEIRPYFELFHYREDKYIFKDWRHETTNYNKWLQNPNDFYYVNFM